MNETIVINGILYLVIPADELQQMFGITIDAEVGLVYAGPESGAFTDEIVEVPESVTYNGQTVPVVGFAGGMLVLQSQNDLAAASVTEVVLPSSTLFLFIGFSFFTNLQKVTCYAESAPKLTTELMEDAPTGIDFEGTPETKELYIPSGSDYSTWETETTWASVNEIYDGFVEIVNGLKYKETGETTVALIGYEEGFTETSITIPSSITYEGKTYSVTEIKNVFKNYTGLTEVNIPDSVTKISETAFSNTEFESFDVVIDGAKLTINTEVYNSGDLFLINTDNIVINYHNTTYNVSINKYYGQYNGHETLTETINIGPYFYDNKPIIINSMLTNSDGLYGSNAVIKNVVIDSSVTSIGGSAFSGCSSLTSITIPNSVTSIGSNAFSGCSGLTSITIPDSVTSIENSTFYYCSSLTSVTIGSGVTYIGYDAFYNCSGLTSVTIPDSVTSIGSNAFNYCSGLTSITIPNSVTSIGSNAFYNCYSLTSITIPDSVTSIENSTFYYCSSLTSVTIGSGVTYIGYDAFYNCSGLTSIDIPNSVTSIGGSAFSGCSSLTSITIPNSVTSIGSNAFYGCSGLTSITIPDSVTSIENSTFYYCSSLTSITIPNSVTSIGYEAFYGCSGLTSITIPDSVTSIENSTFYYCSSLTSITIPNSVTSIGSNAFYGCSGLTSITIPDSVTYIGSNAFYGCSGLVDVYLPSNNVTINSNVFENTGGININGIYYGGNETVNIGKYTFNNVGFVTFYLNGNETTITPSEVSVIGYDKNLSGEVVIPSILSYQEANYNVTSIGSKAFYGCSGLTSVTIPDSVTSIGSNAFNYCSGLTSVTIPNSVTSIGSNAFYNCYSLTSITIPNNATISSYVFGYIGMINVDGIYYGGKETVNIGKYTFNNVGFVTFYLNGNATTITPSKIVVRDCDESLRDGVILSTLSYQGVNYNVTEIGGSAFSGCSSLTSITIPDSVTSIGGAAFSGCSSLHTLNFNAINCSDFKNTSDYPFANTSISTINIGENVQRIPKYFAYNCDYLTSVTIPNSVTSIGGSAFSGCSSLTSINIPDSVTSIENSTFYNCYSLTSVTIPDSVTSIGGAAFSGCSSLTSINIPDSVTSIGYEAFYGCSGLTSINIPDSVTSIGEWAFWNCSSLTSINIPDSVTSIENSTFYNCYSLTSVTIPDSVTSIGSSAFSGCNGLTSVTIPDSVTSIDETAFSKTNFKTQMIDVNNISLNLLSFDTRLDKFLLRNTSGITFTYGDITETSTVYGCECLGLADDAIPTPTLDLTNLTYDGYTLTIYTIKANAFQNNSSLTSVTIPENIISIENYAFQSCSGLNTLNFNAINCNAFSNNKNPFTNCPISIINIGDSVKRIPNYFAYKFDNLTSVTIPDSVTSIGQYAFFDCSSLTSITIPENIISIENYAFQSCNGLNTLNFNAINCNAFTNYINQIPFKWCPISIINIGDSVKRIPNYFAYESNTLTSINIPDSVTSIGGAAFYECINLTSITIPDSVTSIENSTFYYCSSLTSITIPNSVTSIGSNAFYGCSGLTSITIPDSVTYIGSSAFSGCSGLTSVYLLNPTAISITNSNTFSSTPSTKVLFVPIDATGYSTSWGKTKWTVVNYTMVPTDNVNYKLNDTNTIETFSSNNKSETLTIPSTVTYKGNTYSVNKVSRNSLADDKVIKSLTIESGINKIEASALSGCNNLETISIPNSVSEIDNHAFWMCRNLKNIVLPSTLTQLKPEMFVACEELQEITIPDGITTIPFRMFEGCKNLTKVNLPDTITEIQWSAFKDCKNLTTINIPSGCQVDSTAFEGTNITI